LAERLNSPGWATYLRVSDEDKQTPERSFAMQRQRIQEQLLVSSELPFKREYCDLLTGTSPNRPDYQQMLKDAEAGLFSHLGLYRADRFGRNVVEGLQTATKLIGIGIKLRVADMPSLMPETADGFFMFLIQMGFAQREVTVLSERARGGTEAKLRAGGWSNRAPEGYVNKERHLKSDKYERWVELDPGHAPAIRKAWDMLLTDHFTLEQICEELNKQGWVRSNGRPWAWSESKTGQRYLTKNRLQEIFHNPFYSGWITSKRFGIAHGELRGNWEPIVSDEEFERGIEILRKHGAQKSRFKRCFYLLRNLLWVQVDGKCYRMYGSTPSGRNRSYAYYITHTTPNGKKIHIPCEVVDRQIEYWLDGIAVAPELLPEIRQIYRTQISQAKQVERDAKLAKLKREVSRFKEEEARLGRLFITGKLSEDTYGRLRSEWQEKKHNAERYLGEMEKETSLCLDDLDVALFLMTKLKDLYTRLKEEDRTKLLQVIVKQVIVSPEGEIIDYELNSPFVYLRSLVEGLQNQSNSGSEQVRFRPPFYPHLWGYFVSLG